MTAFDSAVHTPQELVRFSYTVEESTDVLAAEGEGIQQSILWCANILYNDSVTRQIKGDLTKYLTTTQQTQLLALLNLLVTKARTELLG